MTDLRLDARYLDRIGTLLEYILYRATCSRIKASLLVFTKVLHGGEKTFIRRMRE